jgi:L-ascorbate metabolism protein UlaG (beta-lactamase superfamily)
VEARARLHRTVSRLSNPLDSLARLDPAPGSVALLWLGQSSLALRLGGRTVLVDPFLSPHPERLVPPPFAPEDAREIDLLLVTHDHLDHLDDAAVVGIAKASPEAPVVVPDELVGRVERLGIDGSRIVGLAADGRADVAGLVVHGVPACHGDTEDDAYRLGPYRGYVVEGGGVRVYHAGDTIPFDGLVKRLRAVGVDLALLPINGRDREREAVGIIGNLDEQEAADLAEACGADAAVPLHWDMFAGNPGDPFAFAAASRTAVLLPVRDRPLVYTVPR